jgi:putative ABC transport system permease protein
MTYSNLKIMLRNLWMNKTYSLINVIGLGIGIAAIVWGFQNYRYCKSFDNFQPDSENIYRVLSKHETRSGLLGIVPYPATAAARKEFAGIENQVTILSRQLDLKADKDEAFSANVHFTEPSFFTMFNFPVLKGNIDINRPASVLITEKTAKKYFGNEDPVGKSINIYAAESYKTPLTVIGVLQDPPTNSSIQFDIITHLDHYRKLEGNLLAPDDWGYFSDASFIKVSDKNIIARLEKEFSKYIAPQNEVRKDFKLVSFKLESMKVLSSSTRRDLQSNALFQSPEDSAAIGPLALAILILLSSCLNFANTTVARSNRRLKEMGIRKVMGGSQASIIKQHLFECGFIVLLGIALSVAINNWWLPEFNAMFEFVDAKADYFTDRTLQVFLLIVLLFVTIMAGGYPAFYISRFNSTEIFRGSVRFGGNNLFSRILLGVQIIISLITVIAGAGFYRNAKFQRDFDYGYAKENTFGIRVNDPAAAIPLLNEIKKIPGVEAVAGTRHHIGFGYRTLTFEAKGLKNEANYMAVGADYISTMKLKLFAGRNFNTELESDYSRSILITQNLAYLFGWKASEAIGQPIAVDTATYTVVGILNDFQVDNLFDPVEPVALKLVKPEAFTHLIVRTQPGKLTEMYNQSKLAWTALFPLKPFNAFYQDEVSAETTQVNKSIATIFFWFAIVSILLTATGFFALISLTLLKKMREIAIRKIVGASVKDIIILMNKGYFWVFIVSCILGSYFGYLLTGLLMNSIFEINSGINLMTIWISIIVILLITAVTVMIKVREAIRSKPVDVLKQ